MKRTVIRCWLSDVSSITAHWIRCLYSINSGYEKCQNDRMLPSPHELIHVARAHVEVCHPTEVLDFVSAAFPVLDKIDPHVRVRGIEWYIIDKAKAMPKPGGTVMAFVIGYAPSVLRCLHLLEQKGMIAFFDPKNIAKPVGLQRLEVRRIRTQTVFRDNELEVGMVLA